MSILSKKPQFTLHNAISPPDFDFGGGGESRLSRGGAMKYLLPILSTLKSGTVNSGQQCLNILIKRLKWSFMYL